MPDWSEFQAAAPDLAATVRERFDAHEFKLISTIRRDGAPRISGIEVEFLDDGELRAGSMTPSVKVADLDRDPRFCLHNTPAPRSEWDGDAKISGVAHTCTGPTEGARYFRLEVLEVAAVGVGADALEISAWSPQTGVRTWSR